MNNNPAGTETKPSNLGTRLMLYLGVVFIALSVACVFASLYLTVTVFNGTEDPAMHPSPAEVANQISDSLRISFVGAPLGLIGVILVVIANTKARRQRFDVPEQ